MSKILQDYSYNIPKGLTRKVRYHGGRGGYCPRPCETCQAKRENYCQGCNSLCPDRECAGRECARCAGICARATHRLEDVLRVIDGFAIDHAPQHDTPFNFDLERIRYIPAITRPLREMTSYPVVSIPFYALWDFETSMPKTTQIRTEFRLSEQTQIIVNFYFKDDKIMYLFDMMKEGYFIETLRIFPEVTYWHSPCFSVFTQGSGVDSLLNFKRQFWIGDLMRAAGLNVIQEVLYSLNPRYRAGISDALALISQKRLRKISQNCQLIYDFTESIKDEREFVKGLPREVVWLQTGLSSTHFEAYRTLRWPNMLFANYTGEFKHRKEWEIYVNSVNSQFLT